jgi:AmmeMemoRadiSam system protein A
MSSVETLRTALTPHIEALHGLARESIRHGLGACAPPDVRLTDHPAPFRDRLASFVTLRLDDDLRGCVGTAYAQRPLAEDLTRNAFLAAFHDTRFLPLGAAEFTATTIEISILSSPETLAFADERDLATRLVPGRDGLILEQHGRRGLFLPQVWDMLPDAVAFLDHLKHKAGLPSSPLSSVAQAQRFEVIKFTEEREISKLRETAVR